MGAVVGLGLITAFVGYSLFYYGLTQVQGGNWGLLDLTVPSKWTKATASVTKDGH